MEFFKETVTINGNPVVQGRVRARSGNNNICVIHDFDAFQFQAFASGYVKIFIY